jgi:hypothetical protein
LAAAKPLAVRMDNANREMLLHALTDGELALVIDGKLTSSHFIQSAPATPKPLPMAEPAVVVGVSDAALFKKALGEYREIANGLIDAARQVKGNKVPENVRIPEPAVSEATGGTIYSFTLPERWGVDKQVTPNLGVSEQVAVLSASQQHTERLLKATPLAVGGVLAKTEQPLAAAAWFNWAGLIEDATPWVDFAVGRALASNGGSDEQKKSIADQIHAAVDLLKVLRTITGETYLENGVLVNHTLLEIRDVAK